MHPALLEKHVLFLPIPTVTLLAGNGTLQVAPLILQHVGWHAPLLSKWLLPSWPLLVLWPSDMHLLMSLGKMGYYSELEKEKGVEGKVTPTEMRLKPLHLSLATVKSMCTL